MAPTPLSIGGSPEAVRSTVNTRNDIERWILSEFEATRGITCTIILATYVFAGKICSSERKKVRYWAGVAVGG